jgi:alkane 1-monooxygenase
MINALPYSLPLCIPLFTLVGAYLGGWWVTLGIVIAFVIHPILDFFAPQIREEDESSPKNPFWYSFLLWIYLPLQVIFLNVIFYWISVRFYSLPELLGIILSVGTVTGALGITMAHELVHRKDRWERGLGVGLLAMVNYTHFRIEHVFGHHKHVATPLDPASARPGESLYSFLPRSLFGSFLSAWSIEGKRRNVLRNRMYHYLIFAALLWSLVFFSYGVLGLVVFLGQSIVAILILESINYIEHCGLQREETSPGVYAPVTQMHSWDSHQKFTNLFLFNLGKHAHHHAAPTVPYQDLKLPKQANTLRYGYSLEILLAFLGKNTTLNTHRIS